jgi:hypothetical protein
MFSVTRFISPLCILLLTILYACSEEKPSPQNQTVKIPPPVSATPKKGGNPNLDKSPADIIYFPPDFPVLKMSDKVNGDPVARVIYSRPSKDGRSIFGNIVKFGEYWRLGANEGTEIEFFRDVTSMGKKIKKGRYILYCIPHPDKWNLRMNADLYTWGLKIDTTKDVYSFDVPVEPTLKAYEVLSMEFQESDKSARLMIAWDNVKAYLPFKF